MIIIIVVVVVIIYYYYYLLIYIIYYMKINLLIFKCIIENYGYLKKNNPKLIIIMKIIFILFYIF